MKCIIDENMGSRRLAIQLGAVGHDVVLAADVGLLSASDASVLRWAIDANRAVLTRDHEDFADLHDLVLAAGGSHPGILVVRFDNELRHNLTDRGIATAMRNLQSSGVTIEDQIHVLNHWR